MFQVTKSIGTLAWYYGIDNILSAILGTLIFALFGLILDKYGPNSLYWWGVISYIFIYLGLLMTKNLFLILLICIWPGYPFFISTEYLATINGNPNQTFKNMTKANFTRSVGTVIGIIMGGILTFFGGFQLELQFALWGLIGMAFFLGINTYFKWNSRHFY